MSLRFGLTRLGLSTLFLFAFACGDSPSDDDGGMDGGGDAGGGVACVDDGECSDGLMCNGEERCVIEGDADVGVCASGTPPCGTDDCDEVDGCASGCADADGDGAADIACGGSDCDDTDPLRYPGATEVCDVDNRDEDCDERTFGVRDADADSSPDANCCNGDNCGDDCDDTRSAVNPLNPEVCDGLDNDCDGMVDEGVLMTFYIDADGDDFGSMADGAATMEACSEPVGYASNATDCNDTPGTGGGINPGVPEDCNGGDEDCDDMVDEECDCVVPSSRPCPGALGACATGTQSCVGGTWGDCSIIPQAETCDSVDNNCNGVVDDGVSIACYADPDGDGYAASTATVTMRCACEAGETNRAPTDASTTDCREGTVGTSDPVATRTFPGASEVCDGIDNDCSSGGGAEILEDRDGDMFTSETYTGCAGGPYPRTDCQDLREAVHPGADYNTTGYCTSGMLCTCGGVPRCITSGLGFCGACLATSGTAPNFDFDCNGVTEPQPRRSGGCGPGGCTMACVNGGCDPSSTQSPANCGTSVPFLCCGGCPCTTSSTNRTLGCR